MVNIVIYLALPIRLVLFSCIVRYKMTVWIGKSSNFLTLKVGSKVLIKRADYSRVSLVSLTVDVFSAP